MRRLGFVFGLCLLVPVLTVPATTSAAESDPDPEVYAAYVKVALTRDGNTFRHPGFLMAGDEQGVFAIECDGKSHDITVSFRELGQTRLTIYVEYAISGRTQWAEELEVVAGEDTLLSKGKSKLTINVDPQGQEDTSRGDGDQVDKPKHDEDDPLGGVL